MRAMPFPCMPSKRGGRGVVSDEAQRARGRGAATHVLEREQRRDARQAVRRRAERRVGRPPLGVRADVLYVDVCPSRARGERFSRGVSKERARARSRAQTTRDGRDAPGLPSPSKASLTNGMTLTQSCVSGPEHATARPCQRSGPTGRREGDGPGTTCGSSPARSSTGTAGTTACRWSSSSGRPRSASCSWPGRRPSGAWAAAGSWRCGRLGDGLEAG